MLKNASLEAVEELISCGDIIDVELPLDEWIPVSERLPEVYKIESPVGIYMQSNPVLICGTPEYEENAQLCVATYCDDLDGYVYWNAELDAELRIENVTAWMSLPEPYKEKKCEE